MSQESRGVPAPDLRPRLGSINRAKNIDEERRINRDVQDEQDKKRS
jgi:hypothetical protein